MPCRSWGPARCCRRCSVETMVFTDRHPWLCMAKSPDTSTAVYPKVQARRITSLAQAEYMARGRRDGALAGIGSAPESLALIGGPTCLTVADAAVVSMWLWEMSERTHQTRKAWELEKQIYMDDGGYSAAAAAGLALARQFLSAAVDLAAAGQAKTPVPIQLDKDGKPSPWGPYIGGFWASMIEGSGLSKTAAALYHSLTTEGTKPATAENVERVKAFAGHTAKLLDDPAEQPDFGTTTLKTP
jgi:hypothetical protein